MENQRNAEKSKQIGLNFQGDDIIMEHQIRTLTEKIGTG
jgi:hypothetical protein